MPRKPLVRSKDFAYHVTNRSNNREWFYLSPAEAWESFTRTLSQAAIKYAVQIHAFVLMSNHYHLLVSTPRANLDEFMRYFQTETCRSIQQKTARINHVFGTRYRWSVLEDSYATAYAYKYVLRNPVRAGLFSAVEDYPYSSLQLALSHSSKLPLVEGIGRPWAQVPRAMGRRISWLNIPTPKELETLVTKALRRANFGFSRGNDVRRTLEQLKLNYGVESAPATFSAEK